MLGTNFISETPAEKGEERARQEQKREE